MMAQVPEATRPFSYASEAPHIARALETRFGQYSANAVGKFLAFVAHETGATVRNNNPTNMRRNGANVPYYVHGGAVNEYQNGKLVTNLNKEFRAYPDPVSGYLAVLDQLERRWPKAIADLYSDARTVEDFAATLSPLPSGYWWFGKPYAEEAGDPAKRAANLRARAVYASALRRHLPGAMKGAGAAAPPLAPGA